MDISLLLSKVYSAVLKRTYKKQKTYQNWLNKGVYKYTIGLIYNTISQ